VAFIQTGEDQSFRDLCAGRVDVIEVARVPRPGEQHACTRRGVDLVGPLEIGADAIVLATKNETDVGGDCVTTAEARDIFRSASPVTNWNQVGFDDLALHTTGRDDRAREFTFFGNEVLNVASPSLADVRSDYRLKGTDKAVREEVINRRRLRQARTLIARRAAALRRATRGARKRFVDRAVRAADRQVLAQIARVNAHNKRHKITVDAAKLAAHNRRLDEHAKRKAARAANARFDLRLRRQGRDFARRTLAAATAPGVVGFFRFSYYELFEDQLRPLEIDFGVPETPDGQPLTADLLPPGTPASRATVNPPPKTRDGRRIYPGPNCVFPSQLTITTGAYPFARRLFLFTYKQALRRTEVRDFLTFALQNARRIAISQRLVPITDRQQADALTVVTGRRPQPTPQPAAPNAAPTTPTTPGAQPAPSQPSTAAPSNGIPGVSSRTSTTPGQAGAGGP
jgi:hypothetical protein